MPASRADQVAVRARALVGVRFRPQGRSARRGLDCVGVAALAAGIEPERIRRDYSVREATLAMLAAELSTFGMRTVSEAEAGDIAVFSPGPGQLHLAVFTGSGFVHADAGLGRVVERPAPAPWPVLGVWRLADPRHGEGS